MTALATPAAPVSLLLPERSLVVLVGANGAGKSTFAAQHFAAGEVLSLEQFQHGRDGDAATAQADALSSLLQVADKRLAAGQLTVIDSPAVRPDDRRRLVALARAHDLPAVAIVLDLPRPLLEERLGGTVRSEDLIAQVSELRRTQRGMPQEGFRQVWRLQSPEELAAVRIERVPLSVSHPEWQGPFDFIGDVHGCLNELRDLLTRLGYEVAEDHATPPHGRTAVFVGDLVDRGPDSAGTLRLVMNMVAAGQALCVCGNHDEKLRRALEGKAVKAMHGLDVTLAQLNAIGEDFKEAVKAFIDGLESHLVLDRGRVVVAHAGLPERYQGRDSSRVRRFALYGDVDGSTDAQGLPIRRDWAAEYRGEALVVYGHTPVTTPCPINRTLNLDTGCAFGGALTALRYPEMELLSVPARAQYAVPGRPFLSPPSANLAES